MLYRLLLICIYLIELYVENGKLLKNILARYFWNSHYKFQIAYFFFSFFSNMSSFAEVTDLFKIRRRNETWDMKLAIKGMW